MGRIPFFLLLLGTAFGVAPIPTARADIVTTGNVEPTTDPATWTSLTTAYVGWTSTGSLTVDLDSDILSRIAYLGYNPGSSGAVTVSGVGSTWDNSYLYVGHSGSGTLTVDRGAEVTSFQGKIGFQSGSTGAVTVTGNGSRWTTTELSVGLSGYGTLTVGDGGTVSAETFFASASDLYGNGIITARGAVLDADLSFDNAHGTTTTVAFGDGGAVNLALYGGSILGVGYKGNGTLHIFDGLVVNTKVGYLGSNPGSNGIGVISGPGSKWNSSETIYVGSSGSGALRVETGAQVTSTSLVLGSSIGSSGTVTVIGTGSTLVTSAILVGRDGNGKLIVSDGGLVTAKTLSGSLTNISGNGTVSVNGVVLDGQLAFDRAHGALQTFTFGTGGTLNLLVNGSGDVGAGHKENGSLRIADGVLVQSTNGWLGKSVGSSGSAIVTGVESRWTNSSILYVGFNGTGALRIESGGEVSTGEGNVGRVNSGSGIVTVTGAGSAWHNDSSLYIGYSGTGILRVEDGGHVSSDVGYINYLGGSPASSVTVTGAGSNWASANDLYVGRYGTAVLYIEAGGEVSDTSAFVGYGSGSTGAVTISGLGSSWRNGTSLEVGRSGRGTLTLADGGAVMASGISVNSQSVLAIDVGNHSRLTVDNGTGTIANSGKIRLIAGAGASAGVAYTPISAGNYGSSSGYQGVGGTWNATSHVFTPSSVQTGSSGTPLTLTLATQQRARISDSVTGWAIGESFLAKSATLSVTTTTINGTTRTSLEPLIAGDQSLRGGWRFAANSGYAAGDPAYLSFDLGAGYARSALSVWKHNGTAWASYDAFDLTYDGRYASFTATELNGLSYAVAGTLTRAWTGGAGGDDWSQGANWNNGVGLMPTDVLAFDGTTRLTPNNELAGRQVAGLKFAAGAGEFHLGGNKLKLAGKIDDQAAAKQEINLPVEFVAGPESGMLNVVAGGELKLSQPVGGNLGLTKTGAGTLELVQDAEYTGNTDVQAGTLVVQALSNSGSTSVSGTLVADYLRQDTLTINAGGKVQIDATGTSVVNFLSIANGSGGFSWEAAGSATELPPTAIGEGIRLPQSEAGAASHNSEPVPEPATWLMIVGAAVVVLTLRREGMQRGGT